MSTDIQVIATPREIFGKSEAKRLRRTGMIPAVVYGAGKNPASITLEHRAIAKALENEAFYSSILTLKIEGKKAAEKIVLKDVQRHPYKPNIVHVDFLRVSAKEKINMKVPLHYLGEEDAPGVKQEGGIVNKLMTEIDISCLPADLPEYIEVDMSELKLNESIHLSQIKTPEGVEFMTSEEDPGLVSIHIPKVAEEPEDNAEGEEGVEASAETKASTEESSGDDAAADSEGDTEE